ncbi:Oidioi.mRNA.OKI2018_I69.chr2.g5225.t1.cds [Oikopleura dioica]|uniref:Oidioi.mRNA.OKI2018_I69.chr2.g5225.t1.cds n=1 Tax=Oikopleura dioica TaxID=34765 RepID=A0ABN7SZA6_OIKDI|nr:Oidioi.mRNA.OKI2018_I69.chr2.g5225.t1.cds [Oikopleura dioica]
MDAELSQVKRETDAFVRNLDASKKQNAIVERKKRKGVDMELKIEDRFQKKMRKVVEKKERKTQLAAKLFA